MRTRARLLPWLLLPLLAPPATAAPPVPGLETITLDGAVRSYAVATVGPGAPHGRLPVIVFLHGSETDIRDPIPPRFDVPFDELPAIEPALIVRPQGFGGRWSATGERFEPLRRLWRWVTGRSTEPPDEIAFIDAVVARTVAERNGDPARIYAVGVSSGGSMTLRLACTPGQPFAAYAAVLATAEAQTMPGCLDLPPVSLLLLASTTDPVVAYRGRGGDSLVDRLSAPQTVAMFAQRARCARRTETPLPHTAADAPSTVSRIRYTDCAADREVVFYRIDGSGHSVPSRRPLEPGDWAANGARNRDIETSRLVWDFLAAQRLPSTP